MDIRAYFTSTRKLNSTPNSDNVVSKSKLSNSKRRSKTIFDSDSDDNVPKTNKPGKRKASLKTPKIKRILDSSDESEPETKTKKLKVTVTSENNKRLRRSALSSSSDEPKSPSSKKSTVTQKKLHNAKVESKFFKKTSASDVFSDCPISQKWNESLFKFKNEFKRKKDATRPAFDNDDDDLQAACLQMDIIGDKWIPENLSPVNKILKKDVSKITDEVMAKKKSPSRDEIKNTNKTQKSEKEFPSARALDSPTIRKLVSQNASTSDSGYDSHSTMSSDSQNTEVVDVPAYSHVSKPLNKVRTKYEGKMPDEINRSNESPRESLSKFKQTESCSSKKATISSIPSCVKPAATANLNVQVPASSEECCLWVEKFKPTSSSKIIGQQGDKSNVMKLIFWLNNWYKNNGGSKKAAFVPNGWIKNSNGALFKAALLSGPPGVGKTTTVGLVCKELDFDVVEFNASDTRSKKLLQDEVSRLLKNTSLTPYFSKEDATKLVTKRHVLVMDEVDGMAGNEDRGGIQELIQLIKISNIPIICICNDRNHPKIRSLVNYCFDLRFSRPRIEQIKGFMRSICFKEKLNVSNDALTDIITSANHDIRLILNHLSMLAADKSNLDAAKKYVKLGAWDVLRKVFSKEDHRTMTIHDKCDLFFFDYSIAPLFVQENYLSVNPLNTDSKDKRKKLELFARAADCISQGDHVDKMIREKSAWSLLPTEAIFASYAPGEILAGYCGGQINFPSWLGKNSRQNKIDRLLQEIQVHTRLKLSASKESINLDYASHLRNQIIAPLIRDGVDGVKSALDMLHEYQLLKEDLGSLNEICQWPNGVNSLANVDGKVKAVFTRMYNKNPPIRPYSLAAPIKKGVGAGDNELDINEQEENDEDEKTDDEADAMILVKKKQPSGKNEAPVVTTSKTKVKVDRRRRK